MKTTFIYSLSDELGNIIQKFVSIAEAAKLTNSNSSRICSCCNNRIKSSNDFIWKYNE